MTTPAEKSATATSPTESPLAETIATLTAEVDALRTRREQEGFSLEVHRELKTKNIQLADARQKLRREESLKEMYRRRFVEDGFGLSEEFERIWNERLRDEALIAAATADENLRRAAAHPIYKW
jgi:hypothetical protein